MNIVTVTTKEEIEELSNQSALTLEGLLEESIPEFDEWIKQYTPTDKATYHKISGKLMNDSYHLTGSNRYPDELTIVSVSGIDLGPVTIPRFQIGGRWLDDVIQNNLAREKE